MAKDDIDFQPEELDFTPEPNAPVPSTLATDVQDVVRGGAQGVTLGFADELEGALRAAANAGASDQSLRELYTKYRDVARQKYKESEERSPYLSMAGNVAGGFVLPLGALKTAGTGLSRVGQIAKMGAKAGAVTAAGTSEAETLPELAEDVATGGVVGGVLGGGISAIGAIPSGISRALTKAKRESTLVGDLAIAREAGKTGEKLTGQTRFAKVENRLMKELKKFAEAMDEQGLLTGKEKESLLAEHSDKTKDFTKLFSDRKSALEKLKQKNLTPEQNNAVQKQLNQIDDYLLGKETPFTYKGELEGPQESGHDKLVKEAIEVESKARATNTPITTNIVEDQETGLMHLVKNETDPATGEASSKVIRTVQNTPPTVVTPFEKTEIVRIGSKTSLTPSEADFLKRTLQDLVKKAETSDDVSNFDELRRLQQNFSTNIKQQIEEMVPGIKEVNARFGAVKDVKELLYGDPSASLRSESESTLLNKLFQNIASTAEETKTGSKARSKVNEAFDLFSKSLKKEQQPDFKELQNKMQQRAQIYDVARQINKEAFGAFGNVKAKAAGLMNLEGLAERAVGKKVAAAGNVVRSAKAQVVDKMANATPEELKQLAAGIASIGSKSAKSLSSSINALSDNPSQSLKNAFTFSVMQNPEYRKLLGITEEE